MWGEEAREAAAAGGAAGDRLAAGRADAADADAELARVQADGPANHRKRDPIDKARAPASRRPCRPRRPRRPRRPSAALSGAGCRGRIQLCNISFFASGHQGGRVPRARGGPQGAHRLLPGAHRGRGGPLPLRKGTAHPRSRSPTSAPAPALLVPAVHVLLTPSATPAQRQQQSATCVSVHVRSQVTGVSAAQRRRGRCRAVCCAAAQEREDAARREHETVAQQLRAVGEHRQTLEALCAPGGLPAQRLAAAGGGDEMAQQLAQQPWYRVLYIAQARAPPPPPPPGSPTGLSRARSCRRPCADGAGGLRRRRARRAPAPPARRQPGRPPGGRAAAARLHLPGTGGRPVLMPKAATPAAGAARPAGAHTPTLPYPTLSGARRRSTCTASAGTRSRARRRWPRTRTR